MQIYASKMIKNRLFSSDFFRRGNGYSVHISGGTFPFRNRLSLLSGNVLERCGTLPIPMRRNRAEISLKLRGKWKLFACAFNGERKFEVPLQFREGKAVFTADNLSAHGAIAVYELQKE